jgi:hypothetical protein
VQDVTGNGASIPSRQALLSSSETLAGSFQQIDGRLEEIGEGVNTQIETNVNLINTYAKQIAELNAQIGSFGSIEAPAERPARPARPARHGAEQAGQGHRHAGHQQCAERLDRQRPAAGGRPASFQPWRR